MNDVKHLFDQFDHLIESLEDENVDPMIVDMVNEAREALEESLAERLAANNSCVD
tara:strand:+ start:300 stop:464 length:165 start_codon:yes stop_codon:yes gene_type:complete